jgi:hypothetical protein
MLRYGISKVIGAPVGYTYAWLTDFRNEDPLTIGAQFPRNILRKRKDEFVWIQHYKRDGVEKEGVRLVTLKPPNSWHNEAINEEKEMVFDYRLTAVGKNKTKLTLTVKATYWTIEPESRSELERVLNMDWDKYVAALEAAYLSGKAATA